MATYFEITLTKTIRYTFDPWFYETSDPEIEIEVDKQNAREYPKGFFFLDDDTEDQASITEITGRVVREAEE